MPAVTLPERAVIAVSGSDAHQFLHNVLTCDIEGLGEDAVMPGALLTPQGKILFDFMVMRAGPERYLLDCRLDIAADFIKRLTLYRLRAKVDIAQQSESLVSVFWDSDSSFSSSDSAAGRDIRFGDKAVKRIIGNTRRAGDMSGWTALRIAHGIAESGTDYTLGDAFPHDVNLDQIGGVSFKKGCYVGQEVVSRMQHRGSARRRILIAQGIGLLPPSGTEIVAAGRTIGTFGTVQGDMALALCRIDRVKDATDAGASIAADGVSLTLAIPPGATFTLPASGDSGEVQA